jgi:ABC-type cobalamin/Fe3+-siderophores transport system ATPase subunit
MGLTVRDLEFSFGERAVLRGLTAEFPDAAITALIGPNGAGKSTLLRLLLGVLTPAKGRVQKDGRALTDFSRHQRAATMAYVPQVSQVAFPFSVAEVVRMGRYAAGHGDDGAPVASALARVEIADRAHDLFGELSAGQQQRVTVARALAQLYDAAAPQSALFLGKRREGGEAPTAISKVLLADEPVSAMDPRHALRTMDLLAGLARDGLCVIAVLHDLGLVLRYAQRVLILGDDGRVAGEGPTAATLTPTLLSRVFGVGFRALADPQDPGRTAALLPRADV